MEQKIGIKNKVKLLSEIEKLANIGIWTWDTEKDVVTWSPQLYEIYGVSFQDFIPGYKNFLELVHPEEREYLDRELKHSVSRGRDFNLVHRIVRPNGEERTVHAIGRIDAEKGLRGGPIMVGTSQDITERLRIENELKEAEILVESERRLSALLDQSPAPIVVVDALGKLIYASFTNEGIFGYSSQDLLRKNAFDYIHPADRGMVRRRLGEILLHPERVLTSEFRVKRKDGRYRWVRATGKNLLRDPDVRGVVVNYVDITTNKRLEMATRELAAIVESSDDAIIGKTPEGIITNWNKGAEKMYGYTAKEAVGKSIKILSNEEHRKEIDDYMKKVKNEEVMERIETVRVRKDGSEFDVSITISPIKDSGGSVVGVSGIEKDITKKKAEERLKDEFIAALSHELRNPLAPIMANLDLLQMEDIGSENITQPLRVIRRQAEIMESLLDDLLNMVRITEGKLPLEKKKVDIREIIKNSAETARVVMDKKGQKLDLGLPARPLHVRVDTIRIEQVLANLLDNASKYTAEGGIISVRCKKSEYNKVEIKIKDNGRGLTGQEVDRIFELFIQGEESLSRSGGGLGIGLTLVKKIVELHGGDIEAESKGKGKGSTFTLTLPRAN